MSASDQTSSDPALPPLPLEGVRVLDLSRVLAGPYCAMLLSMLGAEVIKVEDRAGDESRLWPPISPSVADGMSGPFLGMNLNKRGIVVNLKDAAGVEVLKTMVAGSDVLVENFKTGTMEHFGLGYEVLREINPRLVYTSISAFGRRGPKAEHPGYEALMQAYTGVMEITGHPDAEPARCGVSFLDMSTGVSSALATVATLLRREQTGLGGRAEASLLQTALGLMTPLVSNYFQHGSEPRRIGTAHPSVVPYQSFHTADGSIFIAAANQNLWERLCRALGQDALIADPRFVNNPARVAHRGECIGIVQTVLGARQSQPTIELLQAAGVPCAAVNPLGRTLEDEQVAAIGALAHLSDADYGDLTVANMPFQLDQAPGRVTRRAPRLGEHTREILEELGYPDDRITALFASGAVLGPEVPKPPEVPKRDVPASAGQKTKEHHG